MAAKSYSQFKQKKEQGMGGPRPSRTGAKPSDSMPYKCPSWGDSTPTKNVGWGKDTKKCPTYPKAKGV